MQDMQECCVQARIDGIDGIDVNQAEWRVVLARRYPDHSTHFGEDNTMKKLLILLAFALPLSMSSAYAQDKAAPTKQQNKMSACNAEAGDKKGDERKKFMKSCLSAKKASQQEKMKSCNKDAAGKKGDERKKFMKECLSK